MPRSFARDREVDVVRIADLFAHTARLDQARSALGMASLMYTDPTITAGVTLISATHIDQLRAGLQ